MSQDDGAAEAEATVEINGKSVELSSNKRYQTVFDEALRLQRKRKEAEASSADSNGNDPPPIFYHFHVTSTTNFPVAAGLASSAAGFAAIALAIQRILRLDDSQANRLARIGSGSACRSMYGGLVHWRKGEMDDGSDCLAVRTEAAANWEDLYCIILVFDDGRKKVGSSEGMRRSRETSQLLKHRIESIVPQRIQQIQEAYTSRNFEQLARVIMADSNQFHAVCMDSTPPIRYLNEASWQLIDTVEEFNIGGIRAAYTFDAGPNACVIVQKENASQFLKAVLQTIQVPSEDLQVIGKELAEQFDVPAEPTTKCSKLIMSPMGGGPQE
eukprot:NP_496967.1 Diphosphomevalonate decarboxylase [Caenorhabditis elegans]